MSAQTPSGLIPASKTVRRTIEVAVLRGTFRETVPETIRDAQTQRKAGRAYPDPSPLAKLNCVNEKRIGEAARTALQAGRPVTAITILCPPPFRPDSRDERRLQSSPTSGWVCRGCCDGKAAGPDGGPLLENQQERTSLSSNRLKSEPARPLLLHGLAEKGETIR
jgi:hypothetical protein